LKIVGLISDTHIPARAQAIPPKVFEVFNGASLIIHAGDLTRLSVIRELERLAPVVAVQGNMDAPEVKAVLPTMNFVQVGNCKIGVIHSLGIFSKRQMMERVAERDKLNVLVSGHLHSSSIKWESNLLLINPGSPTSPMLPFLTKPTVALLKVFTDQIKPEIVRIE